ncbi:MAG: phosphoribosyl-ATP diphosphatase [Pseudomonadota bacterium]
MSEIGAVLDRLMTNIEGRRRADPESSYTASLLAAGPERCARKFGEEAIEATLAGALQHKAELTAEAADVMYHLAVLLAANGLSFEDVARELAAREGVSGHDEKAGRQK